MKKIKAGVALLMCLVMLFSFAACGGKDKALDSDESNTLETTQEKEQSLEEAGISLDKLISANKIEALLKSNEIITVKYETSGGEAYTKQVFNYGGGIALVSNHGTDEDISGFIKGFDFYTENGRIKATRDIEKLTEKAEFSEGDMLVKTFEGKEFVVVGDSDEYYKLKSLSEDEKQKAVRLFYFDKATLALTKITFENAVGNTENTVITYDGELNEYSKKVTAAFEGEMKKVKIIGQYEDSAGVRDISVVLDLPASWEYIPTGADRIEYGLDALFSEAYEYPGDGKDYTLYITNLFDDDISGKK